MWDRQAVQLIRFRVHNILTSGVTLLVRKDVKSIFLVIKLNYVCCNRGSFKQAKATNQLWDRFNQIDCFGAVDYLAVIKNTHLFNSLFNFKLFSLGGDYAVVT